MDGFSAVSTTSIYCRPGCAAQPRRDHVTQFDLAAAAEAAGYRACRRCRPYRSAPRGVRDGSELVCRAVRLILAGELDRGSEAGLGARLGVSPRHLRRLFATELGVTPDGLARSHRAHFARRLLDDTDLSVTAIAFASGFGSVRQLNRVCREVFRAPPTELRAHRRAGDRLAADGGLVLRLPFDGPLDWPALARYFAARAIPGVEAVDGEVYRRTVVVDGDPGVLELSEGGDDHLLLRAHLPHWEGLIHVVTLARRLAGLDADVETPRATLADDPIAGPLLAARPGLRPPGAWDGFEIGVRGILGQQVSVARATNLAGRLVAQLGTPVSGLAPLALTHTFPTPETVADADLAGLGLPGARAAAIRAFARAVADGALRVDHSVGLDALVADVCAIRGLGPWTAHYLALRLGEPDAFPSSDLGLRRAAGDGADPLSANEMARLAERWRPWRAAVATRLWLDG